MSDYNGWKNYETWCVNLWITNEESTSRELDRIIRRVRVMAESRDEAIREAADKIQDWTDREMMPDLGSSLAADLLGAALSEVDWYEIAENHLDDDGRFEPLADDDDEAEATA